MHLKLTAARARGLSLSQLAHRYVASLILHAGIAEIAAQLLSLSYALAYLILSDDGTIINQDFCAD